MLTLTGSGTGGLEAAVVNTLSPGDPVLAVTIGLFGDRIADIAQAFGADVTRLAFAPGQARRPGADPRAPARTPRHARGPGHPQRVVDRRDEPAARDRGRGARDRRPADRRRRRARRPRSTCGSTSGASTSSITGLAEGLGGAARSGDGLDERARLGGLPAARMPRYYWDLGQARSWLEKGQTLATPAISIFFALARRCGCSSRRVSTRAIARHARRRERARDSAMRSGSSCSPTGRRVQHRNGDQGSGRRRRQRGRRAAA